MNSLRTLVEARLLAGALREDRRGTCTNTDHLVDAVLILDEIVGAAQEIIDTTTDPDELVEWEPPAPRFVEAAFGQLVNVDEIVAIRPHHPESAEVGCVVDTATTRGVQFRIPAGVLIEAIGAEVIRPGDPS